MKLWIDQLWTNLNYCSNSTVSNWKSLTIPTLKLFALRNIVEFSNVCWVAQYDCPLWLPINDIKVTEWAFQRRRIELVSSNIRPTSGILQAVGKMIVLFLWYMQLKTSSWAVPWLRQLVASLSRRKHVFGAKLCRICGGQIGSGMGYSPSTLVLLCLYCIIQGGPKVGLQ